MPAGRHGGKRRDVLARQLDEVRSELLALRRHAGHIGRRILHTDDVREAVETRHGVDRHVDHGPGRDVVDDDRNANRVVYRLEVLVEPVLARLVVVGRHHQHGIGAALLGMYREVHRLKGVVGARPRDHGHAAPRLGDADLHHPLVLGMGERRAFTRGACRG